ncbi:MAG: hypothetical protein ABIK15_03305 [Pseudomonadota bacterium]
MNISLIDIIFLSSGFIFAVAAIGGDTWLKGNDSALKRITIRGWISIAALSVTLIFGVVKENNTAKEKNLAEESIKRLDMQLDFTNRKLKEAEKNELKAEDERKRIKTKLEDLQEQIKPVVELATEKYPAIDVKSALANLANDFQKQNDLTHRAFEKLGVEFSRDENGKRKGIVHRVYAKDGIKLGDSAN